MPRDNLESRVTALEGQVRELRGEMQANKLDVQATQALVIAVDRDVSEMRGFRRATVASLNALRADMVDLRSEMTDLRGDMTEMRSEMRAKFEVTAAGQQRIVELIQTVIGTRGDSAAD